MIKNIISNSLIKQILAGKVCNINAVSRCYVAPVKRFYKNSSIIHADKKFEITLDQKKLKTPKGQPFQVESEPLALAISTEWNSQKGTIERSRMMLTALTNTAIDNPNHLTKDDIINSLLNFSETDSILFFNSNEPDLYKLQCELWNPIIEWFNKRYHTNLQKTDDISPPVFPQNAKMEIAKYLKSHNLTTLHGFQYAIETVKSVLLAFACIDRFITPEKAVLLSRLEEEYQTGFWGKVEWAHDLSQQDLQARLAAAVFFIHCNSFSHFVKSKMVN